MTTTLPPRAQFIDDAQLRAFIAASGMGLWRFDHATQRFARDEAFLAMLGMPADTPDCTLDELLATVHPEDRLGARAGLEEMCSAAGEPHDAEYRLRCHDGRWLWVRMQGHVVQSDPSGRPQLTVGLMRSKGEAAAGAEVQPRPFAAIPALQESAPMADAEKLEAFAQVPGLDIALGLHSVRGRMNSYLRLLRLFHEMHADDLPAMRRFLAAGQMQELQRLAHSLKGTAATLGASRLRALAAELEARVKERQGSASTEAGIAALEAEWREFAPPLAVALARVGQAQPDRVELPSIDRDALHATLDRIEALLAGDDMAVNAEYRQAADVLRTCFGNEAKQFEARLQAFDYAAALEWLRAQRAERGF